LAKNHQKTSAVWAYDFIF